MNLHLVIYTPCQYSVQMQKVFCPIYSEVESESIAVGVVDSSVVGEWSLHPVRDL